MRTFDYAIVRVVPRVERGEQINAGVILFCKTCDFLGARIELDRARLAALDAAVDVEELERALSIIGLVCAGDPRAGAIAGWTQSERFHWLVSPKSTIVQVSPVHSGLCDDPAAALAQLVERLVLPLRR
jgi:hypothetical protein